MKLRDVAGRLGLKAVAGDGGGTGDDALDREVSGGYVSDLLSDVMAHACEGAIWVTTQAHQNIVAVAVLTGLAGVIIAGGVKPGDETLKKAQEEGIPLFVSDLPSFEVVGRLYTLGLRGGARPCQGA
ncbi:MAG TPA: serine kinase [Firmicutes bacterium]|nr:serine kinase [Bacillota bacterium]